MEDLSQPKPPRALWPVFVWALLAIGLFLAGSKVLPMLAGPAPDEDAVRSAERAKAYADLAVEDQQRLGTYAWVDRAKGKVQIPIETAMQIAVKKLAAIEPGPVAPVDAQVEATPAAPATPALETLQPAAP